MKLLILGGTRFVGRAIVDRALGSGHEVTIVHRGQTNSNVFEGRVESVHADRLDNLDVLKNRRWDACIDTCAYVPRAVRIASDVLGGAVDQYLLISTISVYRDPEPGADEDAPVIEDGDPANEEMTPESYGFLKVLCEREARRCFGERASVVRPGLVVGPRDHTDRFTYWPVRIAQDPRVLTPAGDDRPVQWIDARDLADFVVAGVETSRKGVFHAVGPERPSTLRQMLASMRAELGSTCEFVERDLEALGVQPWTDLPMVVAPNEGISQLSPQRALAAGLSLRPLVETVRDTWSWWRAENRALRTGLSDERHRELTEA